MKTKFIIAVAVAALLSVGCERVRHEAKVDTEASQHEAVDVKLKGEAAARQSAEDQRHAEAVAQEAMRHAGEQAKQELK